MHTFKASDGTVFKYNPDLSEVRVNISNDHIEDISYLNDTTTAEPLSEVMISGLAMREFIVEHLRKKMISDLENIDIVKFLKEL